MGWVMQSSQEATNLVEPAYCAIAVAGVIMHLLLTGEPPSDNLTTQIPNTLDPELTDEGLLETLRPHLDPSASWPDNQAAAIARLAAACIGKMSAVTSDIEGLLLDKDVYPVLERLQSDTAATLSSDDDGDSSADAEADVGPATAAGIRGETKTSAAAILRSKTWSKVCQHCVKCSRCTIYGI